MCFRVCVCVSSLACVCDTCAWLSGHVWLWRVGTVCVCHRVLFLPRSGRRDWALRAHPPIAGGVRRGSGGGMPHPLRAARRRGLLCHATSPPPTPALLSPSQLGQGSTRRPHWKRPPHRDAPHPLPKMSSSNNPAMPSCWRTKNQTHGPRPHEEQLQYCHSGFQMEKLRPREKCHHMPQVAQMSQDLDRAA